MAAELTSPTRAAREAQMFPLLEPEEVARLRRFGAQRHYAKGTRISETGKQMPGLLLVLSGTGEGAAAVAQIHAFLAKQPSVPAHAYHSSTHISSFVHLPLLT